MHPGSASPASTTSPGAPLTSQLHHGNVQWSPPPLNVREISGSWQLPSLRDCICVPELLMMEQKKIYTEGRKQAAPGTATHRFHGDAWRGRGSLDQAAISMMGGHCYCVTSGREQTRCRSPPALLVADLCPWGPTPDTPERSIVFLMVAPHLIQDGAEFANSCVTGAGDHSE